MLFLVSVVKSPCCLGLSSRVGDDDRPVGGVVDSRHFVLSKNLIVFVHAGLTALF